MAGRRAATTRSRWSLSVGDGVVMAEISDDGRAFDPLQVPPPDLDADLELRPIGGLGVHFMKTLMDEVAYRREGGRNILTMRKRFVGRRIGSLRLNGRAGPGPRRGLSASARTKEWNGMIESEKTRGKVLVLKPVGRLDSNTISGAETEMFA